MRAAWLMLAFLTGCGRPEGTAAREASPAVLSVARIGAFEARVRRARAGSDGLAVLSGSAAAPSSISLGPLRLHVWTLDAHGPSAPRRDGVRVYADALPHADLVRLSSPDAFEEFVVVREPCARFTLRQRVRVEGGSLAVRDGRVVAAHSDGVVLASPMAFAIDAAGRTIDAALSARIEGDEALLAYTFALEAAQFPVVVDPSWTAAATSTTPRVTHELLALGGRLYSFAGLQYTSSTTWLGLSLVESLDTASPLSPWKAEGFLLDGRWSPGVAPLPGGKALVIGGYQTGTPDILSAAEIFDPGPSTPTFTSVGYGRALLGARLMPLASGVVLRIGAVRPPGADPSNAELFDPATKSFGVTGSVVAMRSSAGLVRVASGKVIALGGATLTGYPVTTTTGLASVETYDPATNKWSASGSLAVARGDGFTATLLASGKVLLVGGQSAPALTTAEIFDPAAGTSVFAAGPPLVGRHGHAAALLPDGRVLIVGGENATGILSTTEFYDPATASFVAGPPLLGPRSGPSLAFVSPGLVVCSGGVSGPATSLGTTETLRFGGPGDTCTTKAECLSGSCVDGVCCATACTGQCEACNESGSVGTCIAVSGAPRGGRATCAAADAASCKEWVCDGALRGACSPHVPLGLVCKPATCASGTSIAQWTCNAAGACAIGAATPCPTGAICVADACGPAGDGGLPDGAVRDGGGDGGLGDGGTEGMDARTALPGGPCSCRAAGGGACPIGHLLWGLLLAVLVVRRRAG